eukprot:3450-Heterococcus_DN1.PRE.1
MTVDDGSKQTLLHIAAANNHVAVVQYLLQNGADCDTLDSNGRCALLCALLSDSIDVVDYMLDSGAVVAVDSLGNTALHTVAACSDSAAAVQSLVEHGFELDVDTLNGFGDTPLVLAAAAGHAQCVTALLRAGANVAHTNSRGVTALHAAVLSGHVQLVQLLLEHGVDCTVDSQADVCAAQCCGSVSTLMMAYEPSIVKVLLAAGADVTKTSSTCSNCLHTAAAHNYSPAVVCLLIKAGAKLSAVNSHRQTAADVARSRGHSMLASLLTQAVQECK